MRNGNNETYDEIRTQLESSYRTYEEWKPCIFDIMAKCSRFLPYLWGMETQVPSYLPSSYPKFLPYLWGMETLFHHERLDGSGYRSYRTYEEWKQTFQVYHLKHFIVLTVPMRNGNFRPLNWSYNINYVLTVPMRNGNMVIHPQMFF